MPAQLKCFSHSSSRLLEPAASRRICFASRSVIVSPCKKFSERKVCAGVRHNVTEQTEGRKKMIQVNDKGVN